MGIAHSTIRLQEVVILKEGLPFQRQRVGKMRYLLMRPLAPVANRSAPMAHLTRYLRPMGSAGEDQSFALLTSTVWKVEARVFRKQSARDRQGENTKGMRTIEEIYSLRAADSAV